MSRVVNRTRAATLVLIAAMAALPLVAALPARADGFGGGSNGGNGGAATGAFSPATPTGIHSSDDGEVRDLADRLGGSTGVLLEAGPVHGGH